MKILVIDDEPLITRTLEKLFTHRNHSVLIANDGKTGLDLWQMESPDVVVIDYLMPNMNGDQVISQKPENSSAKVCMISAYVGDSVVKKKLEDSVDLFISKPFEDIFKVADQIESLVK